MTLIARLSQALLKRVTVGYDRLFGFSLGYMMVIHQRPTDGKDYPGAHFHIEFYPPNRTATKLKYLAGVESGAGCICQRYACRGEGRRTAQPRCHHSNAVSSAAQRSQ